MSGFATLAVLAHTVRYAFVAVPVVEIVLALALPTTVPCSLLSQCDDPCTLLSWLFKDAAVTTLLFGVVFWAGRNCETIMDALREDPGGTMSRLAKARQEEENEEQAKALGIGAEELFYAKITLAVVAVAVFSISMWTTFGVWVVLTNLFACRFWTFFAVTVVVGLKVCLCAGGILALVSLFLELRTASGASRSFSNRSASGNRRGEGAAAAAWAPSSGGARPQSQRTPATAPPPGPTAASSDPRGPVAGHVARLARRSLLETWRRSACG